MNHEPKLNLYPYNRLCSFALSKNHQHSVFFCSRAVFFFSRV